MADAVIKITVNGGELAAEIIRKVGESAKVTGQAASEAGGLFSGWGSVMESVFGSFPAHVAEGILLHDAIRAILGEVRSLALALPELTLKGASISDVEENFQRLTTQAGQLGETLLGTLRTGTHNTIDDFALMKLVNQDLAAGLKLTDQQFGVLAQGAFALAQATGTDVKTALDTMNDALLTGRTRSLALLTGKIDETAAEEKYAKSVGRTADQLTAEGKLQANRIAILKAVSDATTRLGEQTDGLDERVAQAGARWANFTDGLGKALATSKVLDAGLDGLSEGLQHAFGGTQQALIDAIVRKVESAEIAVIDLAEAGVRAGGFLVKEWYAINKVAGDLAQIIQGDALAFEYLSLGIAKAGASWSSGDAARQRYAADVARINNNIDSLMLSMTKRAQVLKEEDAAQAGVDQSTGKLTGVLEELRVKMEAARAGSAAIVGPLQQQADAHAAAGAGAIGQGDALFKLNEEQKKFQGTLAEIASAGSSWVVTLNSMDEGIVSWSLHLLDAGVALSTIKDYYGLTETQAKALENQHKFLKASLDDTTKALGRQGDILSAILPRYSEWHEQLTGIDDQTGDLASTLIDSKTATFGFADAEAYAAAQTVKLREALKEARDTLDPFEHALIAGLHDLPRLLEEAFTGGGGVEGAVKAIGARIGADLGAEVSKNMKLGVSTDQDGNEHQSFLGQLGGGLLSGGISAAISAGTSALTSWITNIGGPSKDELAARDTFRQIQLSGESLTDTIKRLGKAYTDTGHSETDAQRDIKAALDATHVSAEAEKNALEKINGVLAEQAQQARDITVAGARIIGDFNDIVGGAAKDSAGQLKDLGLEAVAAFTAAVGSGQSEKDALAALHPALQSLEDSYAKLGIGTDNVALKTLMMRDKIVTGAPTITTAVAGLSDEMKALNTMGLLNVGTLEAMERTGLDTYNSLMAKVKELGGSDTDALSEMQSYLHSAADAAKKLGIPLDANTQKLIDQSKDAGIWQDAITPTDKLLGGMQTLVDSVKDLVDRLNGIPKKIDTTVDVGWHVQAPPDVMPSGWADPFQIQPFANEGFDLRRPTYAMVGDAPEPESVLRNSTVKQIVAWARQSSGSSARSDGPTAAQFTELSNHIKRALDTIDSLIRTQPGALRHALRQQ